MLYDSYDANDSQTLIRMEIQQQTGGELRACDVENILLHIVRMALSRLSACQGWRGLFRFVNEMVKAKNFKKTINIDM